MADDNQQKEGDWLEEYEGQLAVDVFQNEDAIIIKAPIAGVRPEDLEISITDEVVTIKGERKEEAGIAKENYFCQECYWGSFSRSYILPVAVDSEAAKASLKGGVLTLAIPKQEKSRTRVLQVTSEE